MPSIKTRVALTITLLACCLTPATGHAGWRINRAALIAKTIWQHPCVDHATIQWATPNDPATLAWTTPGACTIWISTRERMTWPEFCHRVLHEAGHLADYHDPNNPADPQHSHNPRSVMYAQDPGVYTTVTYGPHKGQYGGDTRCNKRGRPYLARHNVKLQPRQAPQVAP